MPRLTRARQKVRMGASALMSALNALPWDDEEESSSGGEDGRHRRKMRGSVMPEKVQGPKGKSMPTYSSYFPDSMKVSRLHSSLHTIGPMAASTNLDPNDVVEVAGSTPRGSDHPNNLHFPFRANTIARRARSPGQSELNYQFAEALRRRQASEANGGAPGKVPMPRGFDVDRRRSSNGSDGGLSIGGGARKLVDEQIHREEDIGEEEEEEEMERAAEEDREASNVQLAPPIDEDLPNQGNVGASLREGPQEEILEDHMEDENATERKRVRKEKLSERLMEVFGLEEREEVIDEMRCWLLRSVSE